jgi:hypothetical protein
MASDVFFTTNPAEFTRLEGLYVSEKNPPGFIRGRDLSAVGISGTTVRGPTTVTRITSTARFLEVFGGRDLGNGVFLNEVWASLLNKPFGTIYVRRITATAAVAASLNAEEGIDGTGTEVLKIEASSVGDWGNLVSVRVDDATDGDADHFNLSVYYLGVETIYENLNIKTAIDDNLLEVVGSDAANVVTLTKMADGRPANFSTITEADWITKDNADESMNLGTTLTAYTSVAGDDDTVATGDETAAMEDLAVVEGPAIVFQAGTAVDQNALNGEIVSQAALVSDRIFLTWSGTHGQDIATETGDVTTDITTRSDRIVWCFNSPYTLDPETGAEIQRPPHEWMASILTQNDVDVHPGAATTAKQMAGVRRLSNEVLTRADLIALREAGVSTLEKLPGMFLFRSARTTSLVAGLQEITRRRSADFLQLSAADRLRFYVKRKNTLEVRAGMAGELTAFSQSLLDQGRIVEAFQIDQESVNTDLQRAQGIEKILWRVRLIGHILHLVLETEIGTGVVIEA